MMRESYVLGISLRLNGYDFVGVEASLRMMIRTLQNIAARINIKCHPPYWVEG